MADDEHGAAIGAQRLDELIDRVEVEVVGRLVQHDEVRGRIGEQHPCQRHAEALAAGQAGHRPVCRSRRG